MNRIRILFSIDLDDQNQVPYGPKHALYRKNLCQTLFCHETSFPSSKSHQNGTIWIGKPFSIERNHQNQVPYGPKHALYRKNLCQTLFCHETSFPSSKIHQSGTIWIRKPFSIDLNDQNQVPYGPNDGLYKENWS